MLFAEQNYRFQESDGEIMLKLILRKPLGITTKLDLIYKHDNPTDSK